MLDTIWISALGALVGAVLVLTGAGGGAIAVPLLLFGAGLSMQQASPVALVAVGLVAAIGAAIGLRDGLVRYRAAALIGGAGMAGAPVGVMFARHLPQAPLMLAFAAFMLMTAWRMARPQAAGTAATPAQVCLRPDGAKRLQWTRACAAALGARAQWRACSAGCSVSAAALSSSRRSSAVRTSTCAVSRPHPWP
jgi:uncharacterized membrane protein YfcA